MCVVLSQCVLLYQMIKITGIHAVDDRHSVCSVFVFHTFLFMYAIKHCVCAFDWNDDFDKC